MSFSPIRSFSYLGLWLGLTLSPFSAQAKTWMIDQSLSTVTFTATQNNAPVTGKFKQFSGQIKFDPAQLEASHIEFNVDMNSVSTSYPLIADALKAAEWFNVGLFPQASFRSDKIVKAGATQYQANGQLSIRDLKKPLVVDFDLEEYSDQHARVKGAFLIKRNDFGVGQDEWKSTDEIKDEVKVNFVLSLSPV